MGASSLNSLTGIGVHIYERVTSDMIANAAEIVTGLRFAQNTLWINRYEPYSLTKGAAGPRCIF